VSSPYSDPKVYETFDSSNPPICTALQTGITVTCTVTKSDTLAIILTEVSDDIKTRQSIGIKMTNFRTPFSSQVLKTINLRYFSDQFCQSDRATTAAN